MSDHRFPRAHRIIRTADFQRVFGRRHSAGNHLILVFAARNELDHPRLGLSVSRKIGRAVVRNRWKRLLREAFRLSGARLPKGFDLVVVPRVGVAPSLPALVQSLPRLAHRAARRSTPAAPIERVPE